MTYKDYVKRMDLYRERTSQFQKEIAYYDDKADHYHKEENRISDTLDNSRQILDELTEDFRKGTAFSAKEYGFLFFSVALQCTRWLLQKKVDLGFEKIENEQRHSAKADGDKEFSKGRKIASEKNEDKDLVKSRKYPDKSEMFLLAVPYDAMRGTEKVSIQGVTGAGKNLSGWNHHVATLGHDPILGYVFGTINIMTRTITFHTPTFTTNIVRLVRGSNRNQYVDTEIGIIEAFRRAIESAREDPGRIRAAIARQALHIQSDKYTKQGLPIPLIPPQRAQELLRKGWNSNELERLSDHLMNNAAVIGMQAFMAYFINVIIETLYMLSFNQEVDDQRLHEVKMRKIIMYSNLIASTSNIIYSQMSMNLNNLDVGGILTTIIKIAKDSEMIAEIKDEFIYGGFEKQLELREYTI